MIRPAGIMAESAHERKAARWPGSTERDLRLDLFRGLALWLIFLDHIPSNAVSWITIRNYGFSDATEIFVFISGYTAAFVYGRAMQRRASSWLRPRAQTRLADLRRARVPVRDLPRRDRLRRASFDNPLYTEEMGVLDFLRIQMSPSSRRCCSNSSRSTWTCCRSISCCCLVPADAVAAAACAVAGAVARPRSTQCAGVRLEHPRLSERRVGVQSVRLAVTVCLRRVVRAGRRGRLRGG